MRTDKTKKTSPASWETFEQALSQASSKGIRPGLETVATLMEELGNPQRRLPAIHVAGTNGKGSVCAMLEAVLRGAGYKTGLYTSPHLMAYGERFQINGAQAQPERLLTLLSVVSLAADRTEARLGWRPTEFELLTAMGFVYFAEEQVDVLVLETGMGGRLDATNLLEKPLLTVITNVTMDHENFLGNTLRAIAGEKAGIIKPAVPLVCGAQEPAACEVISQAYQAINPCIWETGLIWAQQQCSWQVLHQTLTGQQVALQTPIQDYAILNLPLSGEHQCLNLAVAVRSLELLQETFPRLNPGILDAGLGQVRWPCRLELVQQQPAVVLDGAHNPDGMRRLAQWLQTFRPEFRRVILVMGMLADKDRQQAAAQMDPLIDRLFITRAPSQRAGDWQTLADQFHRVGPQKITLIEDCHKALTWALAEAEAQDLVLVTGSLYLVGTLRPSFA